MQLEYAANQLAELGHTTRLGIFRLLVRAGHHGLSVGDIQHKLDIPASTLSHHLAKLMKVGLMSQSREGRTLYCKVAFEQMESLLAFLYEECCAGDCQPDLSRLGKTDVACDTDCN